MRALRHGLTVVALALLCACGPTRPTEAQVREAVAKSVDAWGEDAALSIEEFEVRDWADVRPGLVRVRVHVRYAPQTDDAKVDAVLVDLAQTLQGVTGKNPYAATEAEFDLERWDSGWRARRRD